MTISISSLGTSSEWLVSGSSSTKCNSDSTSFRVKVRTGFKSSTTRSGQRTIITSELYTTVRPKTHLSALSYQTCPAWTPDGRRSSSPVWSHTPACRCGKACAGRSDTRGRRPERRDTGSKRHRKPPRDSRQSDSPPNIQPCEYSSLLVQTPDLIIICGIL